MSVYPKTVANRVLATSNYSVTSTIFLLPAGQGDPPARVDAPYGLLRAGADLRLHITDIAVGPNRR